jgi:hypothetical protein
MHVDRGLSMAVPLVPFWRDLVQGEALIHASESGRRAPLLVGTRAGDSERALAVVRGEAVTVEVEELGGDVWSTLGRIAAASPRELQAHACRVQARLFCYMKRPPGARRAWVAGATEFAATDAEAQRRCCRTARALLLLLDREVEAAEVELRYTLPLGDPWPTGVLKRLVGVAESDGIRVLQVFRGRVPTATMLGKRVDASTKVRRLD